MIPNANSKLTSQVRVTPQHTTELYILPQAKRIYPSSPPTECQELEFCNPVIGNVTILEPQAKRVYPSSPPTECQELEFCNPVIGNVTILVSTDTNLHYWAGLQRVQTKLLFLCINSSSCVFRVDSG